MSKKDLSFQLGLGNSPSGNIEDQEVVAELFKVYNAVNLLASKLDQYTGALSDPVGDRPYIKPVAVSKAANVNKIYAEAAVDLVSLTLVSINSAGRLVKATPALRARGIVLENTSTGNFAPVAFNAVLDGFVGLTAGSTYYLSAATAGGITATAPAAGSIQRIGFAVNSTTLAFYPELIVS